MAQTILVAPHAKNLTELAMADENEGNFLGEIDPFEKALAEFPATDDASISVSRILINNSSSFMFSYHPDEYTISQLQTKLRDEHGGGKFRIRGMSGKKLRMNQIIQIETLKKNEVAAPIQAQHVANNNNDVVFAMMQAMSQGFQELGKLIVQSAQNNAPQYDPQEAEDRFMNRMLQMKSLFGDSAPKQDAPVELFLKGLEFGKEIISNSGESTTMDIMKEAVKTLGPALASALMQNKSAAMRPTVSPAAQQNARAQIARPVVPQYSPVVANPNPIMQDATSYIDNSPVNNEETEMQSLIKKYIATLCDAASVDDPVESHAAKLIQDFSEDTVASYLEAGNLLQQLAGYEPRVYQHTDWFNRLSVELESQIYEDDEPVSEPVQAVIEADTDNQASDLD